MSLSQLAAQQKYWVLFTDKGDLSHYQQQPFLSPKALENRARQGIEIDLYDYPLHAAYVSDLQQRLGIQHIRSSRWLNGISAYLTEAQLSELKKTPFVKGLRKVGHYSQLAEVQIDCDTIDHKDHYRRQLSMLGLDLMQASRYTGAGVSVAVFDNGFLAVDTLKAFRHIFEEGRIIATRDFVDGDDNVFEACERFNYCRHGTNVFSIMAARLPGELQGTAPDASYILLRTENDASETRQEEDNWLAAAEFADSLGAQIFSTSLGYFSFDQGEGDYSLDDLDGETAIITNAADMAASRGIVVINSAGNAGSRGINAPADGDEVIAVGSVDQCGEYSGFSSQGPTADGRIKPDITAMGQGTFVLNPDGKIRQGNGTSFSCPVIAGFMACLLQAQPTASRKELYEALIRSADRYDSPDMLFGYGIPSAPKAFELLTGTPLALLPATQLFRDKSAILYPNPTSGSFFLAVKGNELAFRARIDLIDALGRQILQREVWIESALNQFEFNLPISPAMYHIRVLDLARQEVFYAGKMVLNRQ